MPAKPRKAPKPTGFRDFFGSLGDNAKSPHLLTLNLKTGILQRIKSLFTTMIFERLTLHNFQRYGGTNSIEFPDPQETSLVVILAPNNTGTPPFRSGANTIRRFTKPTAANFNHKAVEMRQRAIHHAGLETHFQ